MTDDRHLKVQLADRTLLDCTVEASRDAPWTIIFWGPDFPKREFRARDLFEALIMLRRHLERSGQKILCAGARFDVFRSGMSRSMGGGRKAYVTRLGLPGQPNDIVDILSPAQAESVRSIEEQADFHRRWIESLKK
jgi:hypothetical protein